MGLLNSVEIHPLGKRQTRHGLKAPTNDWFDLKFGRKVWIVLKFEGMLGIFKVWWTLC